MALSIKRRWPVVLVSLLSLVLLLSFAGIQFLRSEYLREVIHERLVAELEKASGAHAEIGTFTYDWRSRSITLTNIVIHGSEPAQNPALFRCESLQLKLGILTLVRQGVTVSSMVVRRPHVTVSILPNGTTNVPALLAARLRESATSSQSLHWQAARLEVNDGTLQVGLNRIPLHFKGEDLEIQVDPRPSSTYQAKVAINQLTVSGLERETSASIEASALIGANELQVQRLLLKAGTSVAEMQGSLRSFADPHFEVNINGRIAAVELARFRKRTPLEAGNLSVQGSMKATYSLETLQFQGRVAGDDVRIRVGSTVLEGVKLRSDLIASKREWSLNNLSLEALGGEFAGRISSNWQDDALAEGAIRRLSLRSAARALKREMPWDGIADGKVQLKVSTQTLDFVSGDSDLKIHRAPGAAPVEGIIRCSLGPRGGAITFRDSYLASSQTRLEFSGSPSSVMNVNLSGSAASELQSALDMMSSSFREIVLPGISPGGMILFNGQLVNLLKAPVLKGDLHLSHVYVDGQSIEQVKAKAEISQEHLVVESLEVRDRSTQIQGSLKSDLEHWRFKNQLAASADLRFQGLDLARFSPLIRMLSQKRLEGIASGAVTIAGTPNDVHGKGHVVITRAKILDRDFDRAESEFAIDGRTVSLIGGRVQLDRDRLNFSADYHADSEGWKTGVLHTRLQGNDLSIAAVAPQFSSEAELNGRIEIDTEGTGRMGAGGLQLEKVNGILMAGKLSVRGEPYGDILARAQTNSGAVNVQLSGELLQNRVSGSAQVLLSTGNPISGTVHVVSLQLGWLNGFSAVHLPSSVTGSVGGDLRFSGLLQHPQDMAVNLQGDHLDLKIRIPPDASSNGGAPAMLFRNSKKFLIDFSNGVANTHNLEIRGQDTTVSIAGQIPYKSGKPLRLAIDGTADLKALEGFVPGVQIAGRSQGSVRFEGSPENPSMEGSLKIVNGRMARPESASALESVNGTVVLARQRATLQNLSARYGGGVVSLAGFVDFDLSGAMIYHLESSIENVRLRYASGVGVTTNSTLRLTGTNASSLLAGTITVSHAVFNPSADVGNLLAIVSAGQGTSALHKSRILDDLHLDVHIESAPDLQLNTSLSRDLQASVDLRVRGTAEHPALLGSVSANQGDIKVFGSRYTLNRGQVNFVDPVKIDPVVDFDLQTQTRGITVGVSIAGTLGKLNINYRSDPPLQPKDIIALLTLGRTPGTVANAQIPQATNDVNALQSGVSSALGQAVTPQSNRLSKLFGITNVRIDPQVQGIINAPQSRLTLEQQISRNVTITYVTNLSQTSEQIFRLEWALNKEYSIVAIRDDNGEFGIDLQYRRRF